MGWVKDFVRFPERSKCLILPRNRALSDALKIIDESPEVLEAALRAIIRQHRPDLAGCNLLGMSMNYERGRWEVHVEHESFPIRAMGAEIKREPLMSEGDERAMEARIA